MKHPGSMPLKKAGTIFLFAAVLAAAFGLLAFPADAADGARSGIGYCLNILVPSLFPFMVLSTFLVKSGLSEQIGKVLGGVTRTLFRLPGCTAATILMSMIGGYPVGARGIAALREGGFLTMDSDYFLHLTDVGQEVAEQIYEKHCFFTERLIAAGVDPETAERDACRIEHVISEESFRRLKAVAEQKQ